MFRYQEQQLGTLTQLIDSYLSYYNNLTSASKQTFVKFFEIEEKSD